MKKCRVGIICGGISPEHEVSLQSAKNIAAAINTDKYDVVLIGIDKSGNWLLGDAATLLLNHDSSTHIKLNSSYPKSTLKLAESSFLSTDITNIETTIDVFFPIVHGPNGEDGTLQGLLTLANIPYVGPTVLGAAVTMDKDVMKRLLMNAGIVTPKFQTIHKHTISSIDLNHIITTLKLPLFVKPANMGSSVGIRKVSKESDLLDAIHHAATFDSKIIVEEGIDGREIEVAVLGNDDPIASVPGEIIVNDQFYSYDAKYVSDTGALLEIPAKLDKELVETFKNLAISAYKATCCQGMARVDFFLTKDNHILVNELNSIPGFTKISMYPKLWEASGITYSDLIDRLIQLAIERHTHRS